MTAAAGEPQLETPKVEPKPSDDAPKFTQAQLNSFLAEERRKTESKFDGFDDIKAKAEQFDSLTETAKTDMQRLQDQLQSTTSAFEAEKAERASLAVKLLRSKISSAKGLDSDLWDRVTGDTEESITADVEKLVEKFKPPTRPSLGSRSGSGASAPDARDPKERAADALRSLRAGI